MAKDFEQYNFYKKMFPEEVEETKKLRDEARDMRKQDSEIEEQTNVEFKAEKEFVEGLEEDYTGEDIDYEKLKKRIDKAK